jgi:hypothetical protein
LPASVWKQGDVTSLLDGLGNCTLVSGARTGLTARADHTFFCDVFPEKVGFFVVNYQGLICAELAELGLGKKAAFTATLLPFIGSSIFRHWYSICYIA